MSKRYHNPAGREETGEFRDALPGGLRQGRGAGLNPGNRFETVRLHVLGEHLDELAREDGCETTRFDAAGHGKPRLIADGQAQTHVYADRSKSIINRVQSREMGFDWTLNPYRGCAHGCIYCYARPYHEYLGFSSGIDFETRIMAKYDAATLLERELASPKWKADFIVMSGITDCWQPVEEELRISRACLEVLARCRQPMSFITRNRRILRDLDLIQELARHGAAHVAVSITTLDNKLASIMEPRASAPADRLRVMKEMSGAGVPVVAMVAPIIPGLTDKEIPSILEAVAQAGATAAVPCMLRLPYQNKDLFLDWLARHMPDRAGHVESLVRQMHGGKLYDSGSMTRRSGTGVMSEQVRQLFHVLSVRHGLNRGLPPLSNAAFRRPGGAGQMSLF